MLDTTIYGAPSYVHKAIVESALHFAYSSLIRNKKRDISVFVVMHPMTDDEAGYSTSNDDGRWPSIFDMELNSNLIISDLVKTVMHEMVHVWQVFTGRMHIDHKQIRFERRIYSTEYVDIHILDAPWEQEAYEMEQELYNSFIRGRV